MKDLDQLIRNARPQVDPALAGRAVADVAAEFVRPSLPTPWLRIAAALALAFGSGLAAVMWLARPADTSGQPDPAVIALEQKLAELDRRLDSVPGPELSHLESLNERADDLLARPALPLDKAIERSVVEVAAERRKARLEEQRENHLAYVRKKYAESVENTVARLKLDYDMNAKSEAELRAVLASHGAEVEKLISRNYRGKTRSLRSEFATIKKATDARVQSVLSEVPMNMPGGDLAEWGPNPDYVTQSDYESIQRWSEQAQQAG